MTNDINEFFDEFLRDIRSESHVYDALRETVFVEKIGEMLEEAGEFESFSPAHYQARGQRVDGFCIDHELNELTLLTSVFFDSNNSGFVPTITITDIRTGHKRAKSFVERCIKGQAIQIEESTEARELAGLIEDYGGTLRKLKIILVTNGIAPKIPAETDYLNEVEITSVVWDLERTFNFHKTGDRERITIKFEDYSGDAIRCVRVDEADGRYSTYLGFISGETLANLYAKWGIKMLDMNVRVFLSARGNVNKGMRDTIINDPGMFCAYNNGITVFARSIKKTDSNDFCSITEADDFQIVNGGQTTASLYHARAKHKADLSKIQIQMKLSLIHDENEIDDLVPKISLYSNTQNKVYGADLAANEAPHPEIQEISKGLTAPDPTGGSAETYWFYERARGSYEEFQNLTAKTRVQRKNFQKLRPKSQKFDKGKFAKAWNSYLCIPHVVSLGAQKNFARFNMWLKEQEGENWDAFFRKTVALLILWNYMVRKVRSLGYQGYHHNIVAYTLAWMFKLTDSRVDLEVIWQKQEIAEPLKEFLEELSAIVNEHIRDTELNITEYCKKEICWESLNEKVFAVPVAVTQIYIGENSSQKTHSANINEEAEAIKSCTSKGDQAWFSLSKWLKERQFLSPKARSQCFNMGRIISRDKKPSARLSLPCAKAWIDAEKRGWIYDPSSE